MSTPTHDLPEHVGIYGGGRMGSGIAHAFLLAGAQVTVVEATPESARAARARIEESVRKADERGKLNEAPASILGRLLLTTQASDLHGCGLVVEAVPEDYSLKDQVLAIIASIAPTAVLATNTSSLSIDRLASKLDAPERFVGLHFFNPVPASELVEIVVGERTAKEIVRATEMWVSALDKTPIAVTDSPGFASSRLGVAIALEAMRMVEEGVASAEDIDNAMTLGYKHPVGPLKTTDIVGLDVRLAIAEHLAAEFGERFEPPAILRRKVAAGHLGRKTGRGFYTW